MLKIVIMIMLFVSSCSTLRRPELNKANFRDIIEIETEPTEFYTGQYLGKKKNCWPKELSNICLDDTKRHRWSEYHPIRRVDIKNLIVLGRSNIGRLDEGQKELMLLAIAEVSKQLGYKYFIRYRKDETLTCEVEPDEFSSETCISYFTISVISFNNYSDITSGLLKKYKAYYKPFMEIYGYGNNLKVHGYVYEPRDEPGHLVIIEKGAYKKINNVQKVIRQYHEKYNLKDGKKPFNIKLKDL